MNGTSGVWIQLIVIVLLIFANGLFSMSEMAVVSSRKVRLSQRAENGDQAARTALELAQHPTRFLSTVQIGITLVATLTGALGGSGLASVLQNLLIGVPVPFIQHNSYGIALALIVLLITYLSLVIGELVPKRIALANPEGISAGIARPMRTLSRLAGPLVHLLSLSTEGVVRLMRVKAADEPFVTPEEITVLMEQGEESGVFEEAETDIVSSVFRLGDLRAGALMTPRTEIDWIDLDEPFEENLQILLNSDHSHFPVADGSLDNVMGILRVRDLLARLRHNVDRAEVIDLRALVLPAQFVPESMPAFELLELLRGANGNLALVIDEYGGLLGMVTLFDVMEDMVGGISVRGEPVQPEAVQREDGSWLVEGMMRIDEFKKLFDIDALPDEDKAGYQTVGGFVMTALGSVPKAGEHVECCGLRIEVMDMDGLRVDKVLVNQVGQEEENPKQA